MKTSKACSSRLSCSIVEHLNGVSKALSSTQSTKKVVKKILFLSNLNYITHKYSVWLHAAPQIPVVSPLACTRLWLTPSFPHSHPWVLASTFHYITLHFD